MGESAGVSRKLAVITGASSGIGAATARALARADWSVVLVARNREALHFLQAEISALGGSAIVKPADASDEDAVAAVALEVTHELGTPDVIINCAGAGTWKFIEETSPGEARAMMNAPYFAAYNFTHAFMPALLRARKGQIIHVNSPASGLGWPGATAYTAARWALRGLHEALCLDLAGTGVRSTHIVFGKVTSAYFTNNPGSEEHLPAIARVVPLLSPDECAKVILRTIQRPKREVIYPFTLKFFYWANGLFPRLVRELAVRTGRRH